jgi:hypothetical protein
MPTRVLISKLQRRVQHYMMSIAGGHASANTHSQLMGCNGLLVPSPVHDNMTVLISR